KIEPIKVSQNPDGTFVVSGDGNHRIAALKLMGYKGEIPVLAQLQRELPVTAPASRPANSPALGKPIAEGLRLPANGKLGNIGRQALAAIEKVHGDGDLPQIPVQLERSHRRLGGYYYYTGPPPRPIKIAIKTIEHPELTFVHEIGHFLDQQGAGKGQ